MKVENTLKKNQNKAKNYKTPTKFENQKKKCTLFECQCNQHKSSEQGHHFYVSYWRRHCHYTWSSEPREGLAICRAKAVPSFLSYSKTLSVGPVAGIEPATSRSAVKRSTDWANPAAVKSSEINNTKYGIKYAFT